MLVFDGLFASLGHLVEIWLNWQLNHRLIDGSRI